MRAAAPTVCLLAGSALIAGCNKHETAQGGTVRTPLATEAALALGGRPHPKPGLWRTSLSMNAGPGVTLSGELCLDSSTEDSAFTSSSRGARNCDAPRFSPGPNGLNFSTTCHAGGRTIVSQGVATGDFKTSYALDVVTRVDPAPAGLPNEMRTKMQATWMGPCRPDQKPGAATMRFAGLGQG